MTSLTEDAKVLAGDMKEDVENIRTAVSEAITNKDARQSAFSEILSSLKAMWTKITESGIIGAAMEKVKSLLSSLTGSGSGDEGTPLLEGDVGSRVASLPGASDMLGKIGSAIPDSIKSQLPSSVTDFLNGSSAPAPTTEKAPEPAVPASTSSSDSV